MIATPDPNPWIGPAIVAAGIAALVSIITVIVNGILQRRDRQRQLMAEAFEKVQTYREFIYVVRRRLPDTADDAADNHARISNDLSQVQARLNSLRALLKVEAPRVGAAYEDLVANTRQIAGGYIRSAWAQPSGIEAGQMNVTDVDLSALEELDAAYLAVVLAELALPPRSWVLRGRAKAPFREAIARLTQPHAPDPHL
jgi:hypothetical protein